MEMNKKSDAALVYEIQKGNEHAFNELYERYHKLVYFIAYQLTKCEADAEEVKQEVFIKVLRYINDIKDEKRFKYWLTTITHNECKHLFRSNKDMGMNETEMDQMYLQQEKRRDYLPEQHVRYTSDMEVLEACLLKLNDEQREVITLKYFAQLSIDEIASILHIPNGTVKSRLANAKKMLKTDVETYCRTNDIALTFRMENLGIVCAWYLFQEESNQPLTKLKKIQLTWKHSPFLAKASLCMIMFLGGIGGAYAIGKVFPYDDYHATANPEDFDAKATYTILKQWAHCEIELAEKSESEKATMKPLYEQLKLHGNNYYILLEQYWKGTFE